MDTIQAYRLLILASQLPASIAYLKIAYGQNAGVRNIFPSGLCSVTNQFPPHPLPHNKDVLPIPEYEMWYSTSQNDY